MFNSVALIIYIIIFAFIFFYIRRRINTKGFDCMTIFVMTYSIFYLFVPFAVTYFKKFRNTTTLYNQVLNIMDDEVIFFNFLICIILLLIMILIYNKKIKIKTDINDAHLNYVNKCVYMKIDKISTFFLISTIASIIILIFAVDGIGNYLALGSATRGVESSVRDYLSSGLLPLITFSQLILLPPYLYYYLLKVKKKLGVRIKFWISIIFALLYLLYNQGKAPLMLFILPFFLSSNIMKKNKVFKFILLFVVSIISLKYLDGIFNYFSYGIYKVSETNMISSFLTEFTYPFSNFANRDLLVRYSGYRYLVDYIYWIYNIIPSAFLKIVGLSKGATEILQINTQAFVYYVGRSSPGGIPVDFLTYNYYQGGYITLLFGIIVGSYLIKYIDYHYSLIRNNLPIKIILFRISVSIIGIMNNSDLSGIARGHLDLILLCIILVYISKKTIRLELQQENKKAITDFFT